MRMGPVRILLIEDEPYLGEAVREHLVAAGHAVDWAKRLDDAKGALPAVPYDLVLLDLHLPDGRGADLLRAMRKAGDTRPVIILTARDQISDRIAGLNAGADDYLVKPFDLDELIARLLAVGRRYGGDPSPHFVRGAVDIDRAARRVLRDGRDVTLTRREWAVVDRLLQRPGATVAKAQIEDALYDFGAEIESNAVEVFVSRLRKKLGRELIETVRGVGYRIGA